MKRETALLIVRGIIADPRDQNSRFLPKIRHYLGDSTENSEEKKTCPAITIRCATMYSAVVGLDRMGFTIDRIAEFLLTFDTRITDELGEDEDEDED